MSRYWGDVVQRPVSYVPGERPDIAQPIELNTNGSSCPSLPRVVAAISVALGETDDSLHRYPDPFSCRLRETVAAHVGLRLEQVFAGNGSDEVLVHVFQTLLKHDEPLRFPDISYGFYSTYTRLYGVQHEVVPLADNFSIRAGDYLDDVSGVLFPGPNAPTGHVLPLAETERIVAANPSSIVVVGEACVDSGAKPVATFIHHYPDLLVVHTTLRSRSLVGMRTGPAFGHVALTETFNHVKDSFSPYPLDRLAQAVARTAYEDDAYFRTAYARVVVSHVRLTQALQALRFEVVPPMANFVFARHPAHDATMLAACLKEQTILVRHFKLAHIDQHLRITVGTDDEYNAFLNALRGLLK